MDKQRKYLLRFFYTTARWILGGIFIYASYDKILHPAAFAEIIYRYQLFPDVLINLIAIILPWLELIMGLFLIAGVWMSGTVVWSNVLLISYIGALVFNLYRGLDIHCGCFSTTEGSPIDIRTVLWDTAFLALSLFLLVVVFRPRSSSISK